MCVLNVSFLSISIPSSLQESSGFSLVVSVMAIHSFEWGFFQKQCTEIYLDLLPYSLQICLLFCLFVSVHLHLGLYIVTITTRLTLKLWHVSHGFPPQVSFRKTDKDKRAKWIVTDSQTIHLWPTGYLTSRARPTEVQHRTAADRSGHRDDTSGKFTTGTGIIRSKQAHPKAKRDEVSGRTDCLQVGSTDCRSRGSLPPTKDRPRSRMEEIPVSRVGGWSGLGGYLLFWELLGD